MLAAPAPVARVASLILGLTSSPALLLLAAAVVPGNLLAGDRLTPRELVRQSDAVLVVEVQLGRRGSSVRPVETLRGEAPDAAGLARLRGLCLPDRTLLRQWPSSYAQFTASVPVWRRALAAGSYRAVVFVRRTPLGPSALCETETLLAEHWLSHPGHAAWRRQLDDALAPATRPPAG